MRRLKENWKGVEGDKVKPQVRCKQGAIKIAGQMRENEGEAGVDELLKKWVKGVVDHGGIQVQLSIQGLNCIQEGEDIPVKPHLKVDFTFNQR